MVVGSVRVRGRLVAVVGVGGAGFSRVRACLLAEVWVVLLVVVGVDGAGYVRVRACSRVWAGVLAVVWVAWLLVGGRLLRVQRCGRA